MTTDLQSSDLQLLMSRSITCKLKIVWNLLQKYMKYYKFSKYHTSYYEPKYGWYTNSWYLTYLLYKHWIRDLSNKGSI